MKEKASQTHTEQVRTEQARAESRRSKEDVDFTAIIWAEPWLTPIILNLRHIVKTEAIPTVGVTPDGRTLYYNPHFWKSLKSREKTAVLIHELLHIVSKHSQRRGTRDWNLWNIACDQAINYQITAAGYHLPAGALTGENDAAEAIYRKLQTIRLEASGGGKGRFYSGSGAKSTSGAKSDSDAKPASGAKSGSGAQHTPGEKSGFGAQSAPGGRPASGAQPSAGVKSAPGKKSGLGAHSTSGTKSTPGAAQAAATVGAAHGATLADETAGATLADDLLKRNEDGSTTFSDADTLEAIEAAISVQKASRTFPGKGTTRLSRNFTPAPAKSDWRTILQAFTKSALGGDHDYLSYAFDEFGICEDILSPKPRAKICALVDESGSIDDELYRIFLGELKRMERFAEIMVSGFTDSTPLQAVPLKKYRRTMTGGTDVRRAYEDACKLRFDCIIVLTDGELVFPAREPVPTIWAMPQSLGRRREVLL